MKPIFKRSICSAISMALVISVATATASAHTKIDEQIVDQGQSSLRAEQVRAELQRRSVALITVENSEGKECQASSVGANKLVPLARLGVKAAEKQSVDYGIAACEGDELKLISSVSQLSGQPIRTGGPAFNLGLGAGFVCLVGAVIGATEATATNGNQISQMNLEELWKAAANGASNTAGLAGVSVAGFNFLLFGAGPLLPEALSAAAIGLVCSGVTSSGVATIKYYLTN